MANEKRLIDANALRKKTLADMYSGEMFIYLEDLDEAPTVDAVEVVHGRWHKPTPCSQEFCTNCGLTPKTNFGWLPPYCPNCGACMMDGDGNG